MYTLNDLTTDVNTALNYPAVSFQDIKLYLNQAISELNSSLHISIRNINDIIIENYENISKLDNVVSLNSIPTTSVNVPILEEDPSTPLTVPYYFNSTIKKYRKYNGDEYVSYDELLGTYLESNVLHTYTTRFSDATTIIWLEYAFNNPLEIDLSQYIANDWIILFVVPYICFKFSARDNDTGAIFSEEFTQGYQQLLIAYNIPSQVHLDKVAGLLPYTKDVEAHLPNLKVLCPTRAITESFKIPKDIQATFGSMFDRGGW